MRGILDFICRTFNSVPYNNEAVCVQYQIDVFILSYQSSATNGASELDSGSLFSYHEYSEYKEFATKLTLPSHSR